MPGLAGGCFSGTLEQILVAEMQNTDDIHGEAMGEMYDIFILSSFSLKSFSEHIFSSSSILGNSISKLAWCGSNRSRNR